MGPNECGVIDLWVETPKRAVARVIAATPRKRRRSSSMDSDMLVVGAQVVGAMSGGRSCARYRHSASAPYSATSTARFVSSLAASSTRAPIWLNLTMAVMPAVEGSSFASHASDVGND